MWPKGPLESAGYQQGGVFLSRESLALILSSITLSELLLLRRIYLPRTPVNKFEEYASSSAFINDVDQWNDVTALVVTTEPVTFQRIFGKLRSGFDYSDLGFKAADIVELDAEDRIALIIDLVSQQIAEHREKLTNLYKRISVEHIEEVRRNFCKHAELLDPNKNVHTMLRLAKGQPRLELKGNLGGALYLRTMAEMLRRQAEDAFGTRLPEEDELGFGVPRRRFKKENYGAARL